MDVTAEQASARASFADLDAPARAGGRAEISATGFNGGVADLLASIRASAGSIEEWRRALEVVKSSHTTGVCAE
jgi:hypothetical protein